jgi:hypothetical protein
MVAWFPEVVGSSFVSLTGLGVLPPAPAMSEGGTAGGTTARMSHSGGASVSQLHPHTSLLGGIPALPALVSAVPTASSFTPTPTPHPAGFGVGLSPGSEPFQKLVGVHSGAYVDLKELLGDSSRP